MKKYIPVLISILMLGACKKEEAPATKPVEFTETSYEFLGTYDTLGKPDYLNVPNDVISPELLKFIDTTLPDGKDFRKSNPDLLTSKAIADITVTQPSDIYITFVSQNTAFSNSIAFYTYPTDNPPKTAADIRLITYIFPNAGNRTTLQAGDKVKIGRFNAGTSVGFVLLQNAWDPIAKKPINKSVHFCSNDVLNPEVEASLKKHAVLINYTPEKKVLISFEDRDRTTPLCDHDFQDEIIYATITN